MNQPALVHAATFAEYVDGEVTSELKHQLVGGEVFAMAGGTPAHAMLCAAIIRELGQQLRGRPCRVATSDLRIGLLDASLVSYPDVSVVCGKAVTHPKDACTVVNPTVLVEVLSDTTEAFDRGRKFESYRRIESLREYVLASQHDRHLELYRREPTGWRLLEAGAGDRLELASIACVLEVDAVYDGVLDAAS